MTSEPDLLPLPEAMIKSYQTDSTMRTMTLHSYSESDMRAYASANVARAVAPLQAEVEALRAEVAEAEKVLRGALDANTDGEPLRVLANRASNALYWRTVRAERAEARAERLAEALERYGVHDQACVAMDIPFCTCGLDAALEQEEGRG